MDYKNISFIEAAQEIAGQYGVQIEEDTSKRNLELPEQEILFDINHFANKFFIEKFHIAQEAEIARKWLYN